MYKADEVTARVKVMRDAGASKAEIIQEAARMCLGWPYVFAASGNACTPDVRRRFASARPDHAEAIKKACPVLSGKQDTCSGCKWDGVLCNDCRGFTRMLLSWVGLQLYGDTVSTQWETASNWVKKGDIADMPQGLVCCVFRTGHTGMYMGNGVVRHCGGKKGCVQEEKMPGLPKWLRYGIPAGLYTDEELRKAGVVVEKNKNVPTLRKGAKGQAVEWLQMMLNDVAGAGLVVDGIFGAATEEALMLFQKASGLTPDGICGPKTWAALEALEDKPGESPDIDTAEPEAPEAPEKEHEKPPDMVSVSREDLEDLAECMENLAWQIKKWLGEE